MNEDQLYDAAEREMDLYRDEITRLQAEIDRERAARLHLAGERDEARSDFRRLRSALLEGGQSDAAVRKRCLAIIQTAGTTHRLGVCQCTPCQAAP